MKGKRMLMLKSWYLVSQVSSLSWNGVYPLCLTRVSFSTCSGQEADLFGPQKGLYLILANERGWATDYREEGNGRVLFLPSPCGISSGWLLLWAKGHFFSYIMFLLSPFSFWVPVSAPSSVCSALGAAAALTDPCLRLLHYSLWSPVSCLASQSLWIILMDDPAGSPVSDTNSKCFSNWSFLFSVVLHFIDMQPCFSVLSPLWGTPVVQN